MPIVTVYYKDHVIMSQMPDREQDMSGQKGEDDLEQILLQGISLQQEAGLSSFEKSAQLETDEEDEDTEVATNSDVQGALGLFAEATQDLATASVELSLGRHFACVDFCNQAAEKAAQAVSLLRFGHRSRYDHDLRALGELVGMPPALLDEMEKLTPFHPEMFHADTPPEEADEVISAEQASSYVQSARSIQRWARSIVLAI